MSATNIKNAPLITEEEQTQELTIPQAASFLDISEECVNELLDKGVLKFRQDGKQRLLMRDSLITYDQKLKKGFAALEEITRLSEEMGLYDE